MKCSERSPIFREGDVEVSHFSMPSGWIWITGKLQASEILDLIYL